MSLDEKIFYYLWRSKKKYFGKKNIPHALNFEEIQDRLAIVSSLLAGQYIKAKKGTNMAGLVGDSMFFSPSIYLSPEKKDNELAYLHQICFSVIAKDLGFSLAYNSTSAFERIASTLEALPNILLAMKKEYPALIKNSLKLYQIYLDEKKQISSRQNNSGEILLDEYVQQVLLVFIEEKPFDLVTFKKMFADYNLTTKNTETLKYTLPPFLALLPLKDIIYFHREDLQSTKSGDKKEEIKTEVKTDPKDIVRRVNLKENEDSNPVSLLMEGVQTTDIFTGGHKRVDGSDEMREHEESLEGLNIQEVVRTHQETNSIFKADIVYEIEGDDSAVDEEDPSLNQHYYNEWDFKKRRYLKNWCSLREERPHVQTASQEQQILYADILTRNRKQIDTLRHQIEKIFHSRRWKNRQRSGDEIDIDSYTDGLATIFSGQSPDEKFYLSKRKRNRDVSVLILIDASLSSDSWVDGRKVLDIAKEMVVVLQAVLDGVFEKLSVMAFNGKTRKQCKYLKIKDFDDSWKKSLPYLKALEPADYTRIGVAIRHSIEVISKAQTQKKAIILISDGKPTDYDAYEGKYGIQDVRQALDEAKHKEIDVFSIAVDREAKYYFPQMFGKNNFKVLNKASDLSKEFIELFSKLI